MRGMRKVKPNIRIGMYSSVQEKRSPLSVIWGLVDGGGGDVGVTVGMGVSVGVGSSVGVGVRVSVGVGSSLGVGDAVGVGVGSSVGVNVGVGVSVGVGVGVSDGVGVTVGAGGSMGENRFWGSDVSRRTKSFALLSVSSPLPAVSSLPDGSMDSLVDPVFALRSMLPFADGVAAGAVSESAAPPMPTLSSMRVIA